MSISVALSDSADLLKSFGGAAKRSAALLVVLLAAAACSSAEPVRQAMRGYQPCLPGNVQDTVSARCGTGRNVLMAMVTGRSIDRHEVVETEVLEEQRGGFITVGDLRLDFGFRFETVVDGTPQLTSVASYNDIVQGNGLIPHLNAVAVSGGDAGATNVVHSFGPGGFAATVTNSQHGIAIKNISTLSIDIIDMGRAHRGGRALTGGGAMPMELQQSIIRGMQ